MAGATQQDIKPGSVPFRDPNRGVSVATGDISEVIKDYVKGLNDNNYDSQPPIKVPSISDFSGLEYIGYLIEKERFDEEKNKWKKIDEFKIIGSSTSIFYDTRVAYGKAYRYRIKSLIKVTKGKTILQPVSTVQQNVKQTQANELAKDIKRNQTFLESILNYSNKGLTIQSTNTIQAGNFSINVNNNSLSITKPSQLPIPSNVNSMIDQVFLQPNVTQTTLNQAVNNQSNLGNLSEIESTKKEYSSEYYYSKFQKDWTYSVVVDEEIPPCPSYFMVYPDSRNVAMRLVWSAPNNTQKDIKFYKIRKRMFDNEPWTIIAELPWSDNNYIDKNVQMNEKYIYAISSIDMRDFESYLSNQLQAEFNPKYNIEKEEKPLKLISSKGVRPDLYDEKITRTVQYPPPIVAKKGILKFRINENFREDNRNFIIKIKSLDTHSKEEIKIILKNVSVGEGES
jgi:hypothetical protein